MSDEPKVLIHADESCLGNQFQEQANPGGAAGLVEYWDGEVWKRRDYWSSEADTTNNRMALRSAIEGLTYLKRPCRVRFVSDSQYLIRGARDWMEGWKTRGWKRKGGTLENRELWRDLYRVVSTHAVQWVWVRGHAGTPRNEYSNYLATTAAKEQNSSPGLVDSGFPSWLEEQREKGKKYLDFFEDLPPDEGAFPVPGR